MAGPDKQTFAGYEIIGELGRGGMGAVYKARQPRLDRLIALKVMATELASDPDFVARFKREANAAAALNHQNIVQVFSAGESEKTHFIAMEFVEGDTLRHHIENHGRLDPREAIAVTILVAQALQYAWNKARIIHRDIKPENIFLSNTGDVKVGDLGLAKTVGGGSTSLTQTGMMMGSPHYISPEQARGLGDIDFRTDIYSLGCTLYHMLTGRPPYTGTDPLVVINKHVNEPPPAIFKVWPTCPIPLALLVGKMLAKQRHERPASYEDLIEQLHEVRDKLKPATTVAPVSASEPTLVLPTPAPAASAQPTPKPAVAKTPTQVPKARGSKPVTRNSRLVIGAGALAAAALLLGGLFLWSPWKEGEAVSGKGQAETGSESRLQAESVSGQPAKAGTPNADAVLKQLGNVYTNAVGAEMVYVPPGEFMMGSTKEEREWAVANALEEKFAKAEGQEPQQATIKQGFWMGRTEVTVGQWKKFVAATSYRTAAEKNGFVDTARTGRTWGRVDGLSWRDPGFGEPSKDNHAVCAVSWDDAVAFCVWLTEQERKAGRLPTGWAVRLPTEVEWEYACRAGTQTKFWWGDLLEDAKGRLNWFGKDDGFEFVAPVDSYGDRGRNRFGLADMLGNVLEWCLDDMDTSQAHTEYHKRNGYARVQRGGSWLHGHGPTRSAARGSLNPSKTHTGTGFRICLGPDVLGSAATAVSNAPPVITNWQDVMPTVRAEMDKSRAARHEDGWVVVTQPIPTFRMTNKQLGDIAVRGRFRNWCQMNLTVCRQPTQSYWVNLKRDGGTFHLRRYVNGTPQDQPLATLRYPSADEHDFLITRVGDLLSAWVDGVFAGSARDATLTSGSAGMYLHPGDAIRDLAIADLSAAASADSALRTPHSAIAPDAGWQNAINLLPLIDPQKDAITGEWTVENGELCVASNKYARLQIPYQAPAEYDFRISFTRQSGRDSIWQILTGGGRQFDWNLAGGPGKCFGFEKIKEELAHLSPYSVPMDRNLENGRRYTSEVQVRRSGLKAFLDGRFITEWKTDYRDMSLPSMLVLPSARCLGIGTHQSPAIFHRIEVREVTGKGTFTRGAPTSASTTPTLPPSTVAAPWLSAFCAEVAALPREEQVKRVAAKLKELNPQFDGRVTGKDLDKSTWAAISLSASGVSDVSPLRALTWLKWLTCSCTPPARSELSDLSSLSSLKLLTVNFSGTQVRDLSPLRDMPLQTVYLNFCPVTDLSPLENCPLEHIGLSGTPLRDLKLLRRFRLTNLNIRSVPANDLSPLSGMPLTTLNLARVKIRDIALLAGMPLTWLDCTGTGVSDLAPLRGAPLQTLNCEPAVIAQPANAKVIRAITTLQKINDLPAAEFWKQVDAGKLPQPAGKADEPTQDRSSAIDDAFLREVAALPAEQQVACVVAKLKELNPGFDPAVAEVKHTIENGKVATLFFRAFGVTNISPLRALSGLERLNCIGVPGKYSPLAELSPLRGMALKDVNFYGTDVCDLSPLKGMPLYRITCSHTQVADLSPLEGMQLKILQCYETKIRDLSPLRGMPLFSLYCHQTAVSDLSPLANMPLKELRFEQALMRSLPNRDVVRNLTTLEKINESPAAEFWKKVDAGTVPGATSTVDEAFIKQVAALPAEQQVVRVVDELKKRNPGYDGMKRHKIQDGQVIELELWTEHISDISPVRALPSLQNFYCTGPTDQNSQPTGKKGILADLSPLRGMHLTRFKCRYNQLSNLSPLAGHSLIYMECEAHPQVTDLSPLKGMPLTNLLIIGCGVSDLSPLKGLPLKQLRFDEALLSKSQNREILRSIKTLEKINNKPAVELWKKVDAGEVPKP